MWLIYIFARCAPRVTYWKENPFYNYKKPWVTYFSPFKFSVLISVKYIFVFLVKVQDVSALISIENMIMNYQYKNEERKALAHMFYPYPFIRLILIWGSGGGSREWGCFICHAVVNQTEEKTLNTSVRLYKCNMTSID